MLRVIINIGYPKKLIKAPLTCFTSQNKHLSRTLPPSSVSVRMIFKMEHIWWLFICIGVTPCWTAGSPVFSAAPPSSLHHPGLYSHHVTSSGPGGHWLHKSHCFPLVGVGGFFFLIFGPGLGILRFYLDDKNHTEHNKNHSWKTGSGIWAGKHGGWVSRVPGMLPGILGFLQGSPGALDTS